MEKNPLISYCMSTYKRPLILKAQLENVLKQTYHHFEIIISDNDSDASAKNIVEEISDERIKYFCNGDNLGMIKSFNKSLERSKGEFIVMLADDDPVYPDMLEVLIALQARHPGYGVYAGCGDWIVDTKFAMDTHKEAMGAKSTLLKDMHEREEIEVSKSDFAPMYLEGIFTKTFLLWSTCIVERETALTVHGMPDYGSELLTDHAFILSACSIKGMVFVNQSLGGQSIRGDNFGYNFDKLKKKYVSTPALFYGYVKNNLEHLENWQMIEKKLWNFIGRSWVEYSLMLYRSIKAKRESTKDFFQCFHQAFSLKRIRKWKLKFYLKAYCGHLFYLLLKFKKIFKN